MKRLVLPLVLLCLGDALSAAQSIELSHPIESRGAVRVDIRYGRVRIVGSDSGRVRVTGEIDDKLNGVALEREAGAVEIRVRSGLMSRLRSLWEEPSVYEVDLLVEVPADTRLFVVSRDADIEVEGVHGPIGVGVVSSTVVVRGEPALLEFEAISGSLEFEGRTGDLQASTLSGDLRAVGVDGVLRLEAVTGSLELLNAPVRRAKLTTVSGSITVRGSIGGGGLLEIQSESGEITLECCGADGAELDLETRDGEILNEINDTEPIRDAKGSRVLKFVLEGGAATARVRTRSGLIWLLPSTLETP